MLLRIDYYFRKWRIKMKKISALLVMMMVLLAVLGCGSDDKSVQQNAEDVKAPPIAQKEVEPEVKKDPLAEITVSKKELDKLIPVAKELQLDEKSLTKVAKYLKKAGIDLNLLNNPGEIKMSLGSSVENREGKFNNKERTLLIHLRTKGEKFVQEDYDLKVRIGANTNDENSIEMEALYLTKDGPRSIDRKYYPYNLMTENATLKPLFITKKEAEELKKVGKVYMKNKGEEKAEINNNVGCTLVQLDNGNVVPVNRLYGNITRKSQVYGQDTKKVSFSIDVDVNKKVVSYGEG